MTFVKCVFCGKEQEDYKGAYFIKNDGSVNYYSSSKCMKSHLKLGRDRRKIRWTESFYEQRAKKEKLAERTQEIARKKKAQKEAKKTSKRGSNSNTSAEHKK